MEDASPATDPLYVWRTLRLLAGEHSETLFKIASGAQTFAGAIIESFDFDVPAPQRAAVAEAPPADAVAPVETPVASEADATPSVVAPSSSPMETLEKEGGAATATTSESADAPNVSPSPDASMDVDADGATVTATAGDRDGAGAREEAEEGEGEE